MVLEASLFDCRYAFLLADPLCEGLFERSPCFSPLAIPPLLFDRYGILEIIKPGDLVDKIRIYSKVARVYVGKMSSSFGTYPITPSPVQDLVARYESQLITIPEFQRDFVWTDGQIKDLIESVYRGYPIGMFIQWEMPPDLAGQADLGRYWLIDGQQRLLSLVAVIRGSVRLKRGSYKSVSLRFNPLTEEFQFENPRIRGNPLWVAVKDLIEKPLYRVIDNLKQGTFLSEDEIALCERRLDRLRSNLTAAYHVPVCTLSPDLTPEQAASIFIKLNSTGTRVKSAELYLATFAIMLPREIANEVYDFLEELKRSGWDIEVSVPVKTTLAFLTRGKVKIANTVVEQLRILRRDYEAARLKEAWVRARESIEKTFKILEENLGLDTADILPSQAVLITMAYYIGSKYTLAEDDVRRLLLWFLLASYWGRYSSAHDTRLNEDLGIINSKLNDPWKELLGKIKELSGRLLLSEEDFQGWDVDRLLLLYVILKQRGALSLFSRRPLTASIVQVHHIFPRALLEGHFAENLIDDVANKTLVTPKENIRAGAREPLEYLFKHVDDRTLETHMIPKDATLLRRDKFEDFLKARREMLVSAINEYLRQLGPDVLRNAQRPFFEKFKEG